MAKPRQAVHDHARARELERMFLAAHPQFARHLQLGVVVRVKRGFKGPYMWIYALHHAGGRSTSADSIGLCIERFVAVCTAARLTGWVPSETAPETVARYRSAYTLPYRLSDLKGLITP
ncbi:MAG: hypothetical protein JSS14_22205 [Proteobacteria bacterium]|nr:hypothetical protein [Pseudomonadota bacterium]